MDGRSTYLALREIDPDVRVLLTTGYALNDEAQRILDLAVPPHPSVAFVAKPYTLERLSEALARMES
jgi:CheY-like chemotaxis protein